MFNYCMQKVCDIRLFNAEYLAIPDISITHTISATGLLYLIKIRGRPRVKGSASRVQSGARSSYVEAQPALARKGNIRLFLERTERSLHVFYSHHNVKTNFYIQ